MPRIGGENDEEEEEDEVCLGQMVEDMLELAIVGRYKYCRQAAGEALGLRTTYLRMAISGCRETKAMGPSTVLVPVLGSKNKTPSNAR